MGIDMDPISSAFKDYGFGDQPEKEDAFERQNIKSNFFNSIRLGDPKPDQTAAWKWRKPDQADPSPELENWFGKHLDIPGDEPKSGFSFEGPGAWDADEAAADVIAHRERTGRTSLGFDAAEKMAPGDDTPLPKSFSWSYGGWDKGGKSSVRNKELVGTLEHHFDQFGEKAFDESGKPRLDKNYKAILKNKNHPKYDKVLSQRQARRAWVKIEKPKYSSKKARAAAAKKRVMALAREKSPGDKLAMPDASGYHMPGIRPKGFKQDAEGAVPTDLARAMDRGPKRRRVAKAKRK
tara:strand:+ start:53 stop:931 length:879 start_codon:yes stop_codon:yes gene_type:complete